MASVLSENFIFSKGNLLNSSPVLEDLRKSGKLCDIDIKAGNQTISAHRVILAAVIPYFHRIICSTDSKNGGKIEIVMKSIAKMSKICLLVRLFLS